MAIKELYEYIKINVDKTHFQKTKFFSFLVLLMTLIYYTLYLHVWFLNIVHNTLLDYFCYNRNLTRCYVFVSFAGVGFYGETLFKTDIFTLSL
jgi:hypothetical protein